MTIHQQKQKEVIDDIEMQVKNNSLNFSTVFPVVNYENDPRLCLTSVHFPNKTLLEAIQTIFIAPLKDLAPKSYFYSDDSLHITIKNIRIVSDPPNFTQEDVVKAEKVFSEVIPNYKKFNAYFYKLLLFPNNLALIGTTDEELDKIVLDLDQRLMKEGIPDDKKYTNTQYFFSNMTLARFSSASDEFKNKVKELSDSLRFEPYTIDSVTLLTCNAALKNRKIIGKWNLQ